MPRKENITHQCLEVTCVKSPSLRSTFPQNVALFTAVKAIRGSDFKCSLSKQNGKSIGMLGVSNDVFPAQKLDASRPNSSPSSVPSVTSDSQLCDHMQRSPFVFGRGT